MIISEQDTQKVTRVEVIGDHGRLFTLWGLLAGIELQLQDDGRTLKVFLKGDSASRQRP